MKKNIYLILICTLILSSCLSPKAKSVLFIGNNFTYANDLPLVFLELSESLGYEVFVASSAVPNFRILDHLSYPESLAIIDEHEWDLIILQELATVIINSDRHKDELYLGSSKFKELMDRKGYKPAYMNIWGFKHGAFYPGMNSYDEMQNVINKESVNISKTFDFNLIPVGQAWQMYHTDYPDADLWSNRDNRHPGPAGTYMAACVIYSYLYNESAEGSDSFPMFVSENDAERIQEYAYRTVLEFQNE